MLRESKIVTGRPTLDGSTEHVYAFGESDDAPRLVAVLADRLKAHAPSDSPAAGAAARCLDPRATWNTRLTSLAAALDEVLSRPDAPTLVLWDADALAATQSESFDVERSSLLRRDLFRVVRASAERGGWVLVRTAPAPGSALDDLDVRRVGGESALPTELPEQVQLFASDVHPLASWLVRSQVLRPQDLAAIHRTVAEPDAHLVDLVYQALPSAIRDAAKLLSGLRAPQPLNGHYGRVLFTADASVTDHSVPAAARERLQDCGFLQPTPTRWRMPRLVRARLYRLAETTLGDHLAGLHHREATVGIEPDLSVDAAVEAHHHALCTGDPSLARTTARYYGSELAELARRISLTARDAQGDERRRGYRDAADLFRFILDNYDREDAYAWEYLGYNLALAGGSPDDVLAAYRNAHTRRFHNPLYHGRLIGFRGELGEHVVDEAIAGIRAYAQHDPSREPVSYFAKTVLDGLGRGGHRDQIQAILAACGPTLRQYAPKLLGP